MEFLLVDVMIPRNKLHFSSSLGNMNPRPVNSLGFLTACATQSWWIRSAENDLTHPDQIPDHVVLDATIQNQDSVRIALSKHFDLLQTQLCNKVKLNWDLRKIGETVWKQSSNWPWLRPRQWDSSDLDPQNLLAVHQIQSSPKQFPVRSGYHL